MRLFMYEMSQTPKATMALSNSFRRSPSRRPYAASLGGSVNLETGPFSEAPEARAVVGYGSYETKRLMLEMNSGRLAGGWNAYGRYSRIESFGYRDQSWSRLWSYALTARRIIGRQTFRLNLYGGPEETHLAYGKPQSAPV